MAGGLETARDYFVSVAKRTVGIDGYQRVRTYLGKSFGDAAARDIGVVLPVGIIAGTASQVVMPAINELIPRLVTEHPDRITTLVRYILPPTAATHVGLDLGGEAIKRIKSFRPSATTLTV